MVNNLFRYKFFFLTTLYAAGILWVSLQPGAYVDDGLYTLREALMDFLHIPAYAGLAGLLVLSFGGWKKENSAKGLKTHDRRPTTEDRKVGSLWSVVHGLWIFLFRIPYSVILSFLIATAYGILNEFVQAGVPGRDFSVGDMLRNALGAMIGIVAVKIIRDRHELSCGYESRCGVKGVRKSSGNWCLSRIIFFILVLALGVVLGGVFHSKLDFPRIHNAVKKRVVRKLEAVGLAPSQENLAFGQADMDSAQAKVRVTVFPAQEKGTVSPLIYGTNFAPKMESTRDILAFMKEIGITCFRYPGGDAPGWRWRGGYADFNDKVVNMPMGRVQAVSGLSRITGAKVIMQVNIESGSPEEAAGLVKYMNQESGTPVTYWELGNEAFGDWDAGHTTPEKYAQLIKDYSAAMKAVDPMIKIGANWASTYADNVRWDETILRLAGDEIDFLSIHWYPNHTSEGKAYRGRIAPLPEEVMANSLAVSQIVRRARLFIEKYAPRRVGKIELTFLEWDGAWDAPTNDTKNKQGVVNWSLANALFYADTFGQFAENGVTVATHYRFQECPFGLIRGWDQAEGWGGQRWDGVTIRPKAFALQLFSKFFGDVLIEKKVEGGLSYIKEQDWWQDSYAGPVPYVSVYTSKHTATDTVRIALINRHPDAEIPVDIVIDDGTGVDRTCVAWILTGPDLLSQNDGAPGTVKIRQSEAFFVNSSFPFPVPPRSVVMLEVGEARD